MRFLIEIINNLFNIYGLEYQAIPKFGSFHAKSNLVDIAIYLIN